MTHISETNLDKLKKSLKNIIAEKRRSRRMCFLQLEGENPMEIGLRIDNKIKELYPDIVKNGVQVHCAYDDRETMWRVLFKKDKYALKTLLEKKDVDLLLSGNRCLSLTVELQQLADSINRLAS